MKKVKYFYNTHTLRYEKLETPLRVRLLQVIGFIAASIVTGLLIYTIAFRYFASPREKILKQQNESLQENYSLLMERVNQLELQMDEIENRDNQVYRTIFGATPIPDSARVKDMERRGEVKLIQNMGEDALISSIHTQLNRLALLEAYQMKSFDEINRLVKNKEIWLASMPSIQPISNKNLTRIGSGFGYRIDPVYKDRREHKGIDFTAPLGTPIYATGDGKVVDAGFSTGGHGNRVVINHGFGYQSLYGHMYRIKARVGDEVKRGQVIGYVGTTGKSTGPHVHYEVLHNGVEVDPIYFFYNDLSPSQFDRILKLAATSNQSMD